jgi:uncharacterized membrane protein
MKTTERPRKDFDAFTVGKGRFEAFSDGVFAIAITLLILEVRLPNDASPSWTNAQQAQALIHIWPQYLVYAASFATIGIMWLNHHALFDNARVITHGMVVANLVLLAFVSFLPFTTEALGRFGLSGTAVVYYGLTMIAISLAYNQLFQQVRKAHPQHHKPTFILWNVVGNLAYPFATVIGYFVPVLGVIIIGLLAVFYMLPSNLRSVRLDV